MAGKRFVLHPFERQILRRRWSSQAIDAEIHALMGDDVDALLGKAGSMFFVCLLAAKTDKISADHPDVRVIRGAINALGDLSGAASITDLQRGSVYAGVEAVKRLAAELRAESLYLGAKHLQAIAVDRPVMLSDFLQVAQP